MAVLKVLNFAVRFLLELCMLAAVTYWGFKTQSGWLLKILLGIGLPVLIAVLWGMFIAPRATRPLSGAPRLTLELLLFASGAIALFASGKPTLGWVYTITLIVNEVLLFLWKE
jgi:branched-subunit amino acid ABC-type transport system permease component